MSFPQIDVKPLDTETSFRIKAYKALKHAITEMDIYGHAGEIKLEERQLSEMLGVSRTPIREAMTLLEQEGFVRSVPRRGIFVIRKSKAEVLEMVTVWAALESMAARLASARASDHDLASLREVFHDFEEGAPAEHMNEYSDANIRFHQTIIGLSGCAMIGEMTENLFIHIRGIRAVSVRQENRSERSLQEHRAIISALVARDADLAERLVREHTLGLAAHVEKHGKFPS
jgi:DNA-binding GntR family transcriptional regulator